MSSFSTISFFLLLSLWTAVISDGASYIEHLSLPKDMVGPQFLALHSTGKGFYTGVSGGRILNCTTEPWLRKGEKQCVVVAVSAANSYLCSCNDGRDAADECGRPAGMALNEKTGDLYIADAKLGLLVVPHATGFARKIADSVDGKPLMHLNGLDIDPTTGVVYFTSFSARFTILQQGHYFRNSEATGKLLKYDPSTMVVTVLMDGLGSSSGCAVSSDGSFVLVSQFTKNNIKKYWIKGAKAGSSEDFTNWISGPTSIRRIGSTGNFWVNSAKDIDGGLVSFRSIAQSAFKFNSNGELLQKIYISSRPGYISDVNEFNGWLYIGTPHLRFVEILKL